MTLFYTNEEKIYIGWNISHPPPLISIKYRLTHCLLCLWKANSPFRTTHCWVQTHYTWAKFSINRNQLCIYIQKILLISNSPLSKHWTILCVSMFGLHYILISNFLNRSEWFWNNLQQIIEWFQNKHCLKVIENINQPSRKAEWIVCHNSWTDPK